MATLTTAQLQALKTAINAETDTTFAGYRTANDKFSMAAWLNLPSTTVVWRTGVSKREVIASAAFDWTRVDNLSVGKARIWDQLFSAGDINPSQANVRAGIDATWAAAGDANTLAGIYVVIKRLANRFEKIYATGTGTNAVPAALVVEGSVTSSQIGDALES